MSDPDPRQDRTCDHCGVYVPRNRTGFFTRTTGHRHEDGQVEVLVTGLCLRCAVTAQWPLHRAVEL